MKADGFLKRINPVCRSKRESEREREREREILYISDSGPQKISVMCVCKILTPKISAAGKEKSFELHWIINAPCLH